MRECAVGLLWITAGVVIGGLVSVGMLEVPIGDVACTGVVSVEPGKLVVVTVGLGVVTFGVVETVSCGVVIDADPVVELSVTGVEVCLAGVEAVEGGVVVLSGGVSEVVLEASVVSVGAPVDCVLKVIVGWVMADVAGDADVSCSGKQPYISTVMLYTAMFSLIGCTK